MFLLVQLLLLAMAVIAVAPDSFLGRALRRALVETPARWIAGDPFRMLIGAVVVVGLIAFALGAPELIALAGIADVAAYLDLTAVVVLLGAAQGAKGLATAVVVRARRVIAGLAPQRAGRFAAHRRTPRTQRPRIRTVREDAEPPGLWAAA